MLFSEGKRSSDFKTTCTFVAKLNSDFELIKGLNECADE